jgi:predicted nucleic acid-binding Zn ribbon protein
MDLRPCQECGKPYENPSKLALFCSTGCRLKFNRRRRDRGTELYDLVMSARFETNGATKDLVERLLNAYRDSDKTKRGGRMSWQTWKTAQYRIPQSYSKSGDMR